MTKRYFVWKDANCNGKNIDWIEMKGKEFTLFKREPENNHRRFIRLGDPELDEEIIFIEATKQKYDEWNREQAHKKRVEEARKESGYSEVSLSTSLCDNSGETIDIYIADSDCDVKASVLKFIEKEALQNALHILTEEEKKLVNILYYDNPENLSERKIGERYNIPQKTLNNRKNKKIFGSKLSFAYCVNVRSV